MNLNPDFIPSSIDDAINYIVANLDNNDLEFIQGEDYPAAIHHTMGRLIRNNWSLWDDDTPIKRDFQKRFNLFGHADDISGIIFTGVWTKIKGGDLVDTLNRKADSYRNHWVKMDIDPVTGIKHNES